MRTLHEGKGPVALQLLRALGFELVDKLIAGPLATYPCLQAGSTGTGGGNGPPGRWARSAVAPLMDAQRRLGAVCQQVTRQVEEVLADELLEEEVERRLLLVGRGGWGGAVSHGLHCSDSSCTAQRLGPAGPVRPAVCTPEAVMLAAGCWA